MHVLRFTVALEILARPAMLRIVCAALAFLSAPAAAQTPKGSSVNSVPADVLQDLAPTGQLRAALNYGNGVLVQRGPGEQEPKGVSPDLARELAKRLGVPVVFVGFEAAGKVFEALKAPDTDPRKWDIAFLA